MRELLSHADDIGRLVVSIVFFLVALIYPHPTPHTKYYRRLVLLGLAFLIIRSAAHS